MKKLKRINALDAFFLLLFLLSVISVLGRLANFGSGEAEEENATIVLHVSGAAAETADCLRVGEEIYTASGELYGTVRGFAATPARVVLESDGVFYVGAWDITARVDLWVEITVAGRTTETVFLWKGRQAILTGQALSLWSERVFLHGKVTRVLPEAAAFLK